MAGLSRAHLVDIRDRYPPGPRTFVESGTNDGRTTKLALALFDTVHTIELGEELYRAHAPSLTKAGAICHQGDSAKILPELAVRIAEPALFFLDAHWTAMRAGAVRGSFPLWHELRAIAARHRTGDIVIVDDVHCFGHERPQPEWRGVALENILGHLGAPRTAGKLEGDQAVVFLR